MCILYSQLLVILLGFLNWKFFFYDYSRILAESSWEAVKHIFEMMLMMR